MSGQGDLGDRYLFVVTSLLDRRLVDCPESGGGTYCSSNCIQYTL